MKDVLATLRARWKLVLGLSVLGLVLSVSLVLAGAAGLAWTNTEEF